MTGAVPPLLRENVQEVLMALSFSAEQERVLLWLVWLPLLSRDELGRCVDRDASTVWEYLSPLVRAGIVDRVCLRERGWPQAQRYYLTDLGLFVLAARQTPPLSVPRLVQRYPVTRADLLARLATPVVHLVLSDLVSRLVAECPAGTALTSYQQPWQHYYTSMAGQGHRFSCDSALLLQAPWGEQYAFYVRVDQPECMFNGAAEKKFLSHLVALRLVAQQTSDPVPHLLLLTSPERFASWSALLDELPLQHGTTPLEGAITDLSTVQTAIFGPRWISFRDLPRLLTRQDERRSSLRTLLDLCETPATPALIEQFAQTFSLSELALHRGSGLLTRQRASLPRYVGASIQQEANTLAVSPSERTALLIADGWHAPKADRRALAAWLSLLLTADQKAIVVLLMRHPLLSEEDLQAVLFPKSKNVRAIRTPLEAVIDLNLVQRVLWPQAADKRDAQRFCLSESGLRFLAMRQLLPPAFYLTAETPKEKDRQVMSPLASDILWMQRGGPLLFQQLAHTNGLYHAMRHIIQVAQHSRTHTVVCWKSAREALLWHRDELTGRPAYPRPDAELWYLLPGEMLPHVVLIEFDMGSSYFREYAGKFETYHDYQAVTETMLPPILMILHHPQRRKAILDVMHEIGATDVRVVLISEQDIQREGFEPLLRQLHPFLFSS